MSIPTLQHIAEELAEANAFTASIRGFAVVESLLDLILREALPIGDSFDSERVTAALKIDLVVALGIIPTDDAPALRRLARIRNSFAHDFDATFDDAAQRDLENVLSLRVRTSVAECGLALGSPAAALRWITLACIAHLLGLVQRRREAQLESEAWQEVLHETAERLRKANPELGNKESTYDRRAQEKVEAKRRERGWSRPDDRERT